MKKIFKIVLLVLVPLIVLWTFYYLWKKSQPVQKIYETEVVKYTDIQKRTVATGKIEPRTEVLIKPQMSGIIAELFKEAGAKVKAGDIIARIKVIPDMMNLNSAELRVERANLSFEQTKRNFERDKRLFEEKVISKEEFEKTQLQYKNDEQELKAAKDNLSLTRDGVSISSKTSTNTLVRSTINGTILDIPVKVGNSVIQSNNFNDGTTIASVANMSDMLFVGKLDETEVGKVNVGMTMDIMIGALQDKKMNAVLEYISPKGTEENGAIMFQMKAAVRIPDKVFVRAGYSANAEIILTNKTHVLSLPESSIEFSGDTAYVYVLKTKEPQAFQKKMVKVGLSDGIKIEIQSGLKLKDVVRGVEKQEKK